LQKQVRRITADRLSHHTILCVPTEANQKSKRTEDISVHQSSKEKKKDSQACTATPKIFATLCSSI
jgi:hypothetical protein